MFKLFDKDFFKFFMGFLVILIISFFVFYLTARVGVEAGIN
jgi:hypothetical protein